MARTAKPDTYVPIDREKILQSAQKYVDKKKYDRAIAEYQRIVQDDPTDARTLLKIGDLQARLQAYPEAIATYDRVGQHYATQGFALKAIAVYKQIRELIRKHAPNLADRYAHILPKLADIYSQLGLISDALATYDEVATRLQVAGRDHEAADVFRKMVSLDASNPLPHLRLAEACCRVQKLNEAIDSFWTAAELLLRVDRHEDALKVVERILHFRPEPRFALTAAELYLRRGQREDGLQALAKLQVCFQADPRNLDTLNLLAQAFTMIGQDAKSIEVYKEMARIAREQGKLELFNQLLSHLYSVAPNDEQVRALQSLRPHGLESAPPSARNEISVEDQDVEFLEEETGSQTPFELQPREAAQTRASTQRRPALASGPDVVVDLASAAQERSGQEPFDPSAHSRKAVVDAESFRKLRLYSKAIEALHIALEIDPNSLDIRYKLREILSEAGKHKGALNEAVNIAAIYLDREQPALAEPLLYEVLETEPDHPDALALLEQLNAPPEPTVRSAAPAALSAARGTALRDIPSLEPDALLDAADGEPGTELESLGNQRAADPFDGLDAIDDPFAPNAAERSGQGATSSVPALEEDLMAGLDGARPELRDVQPPRAPALPRFAEAEAPAALAGGSREPEAPTASHVSLPALSLHTSLAAHHEQPEAVPSAPPSTLAATIVEAAAVDAAPGHQLAEVLDEAAFFSSRGLFDDAKAILQEQLARTPEQPLLLQHLHRLEQELANGGASQTIERAAIAGTSKSPGEEDRAFDIAASLDALDQLDQAAPSQTAPKHGFASMQQEVDVDQVFAKFKEGIRAQVSDADTATHYDLGVAYKEMGLLSDAINEFQIASRDAARECMCFAMIGMIELERGDLDSAADCYIRALNAVQKTVEQEMALYYDLGNVYEMKKRPQDALYYFQKIARRDPGYRDVKDRITALQPPAQSVPPARAVNDDDEFDRVFDELFDVK